MSLVRVTPTRGTDGPIRAPAARHARVALLCLLCASLAPACERGHDPNWLTDPAYPDLSGHDRYLLLARTPHDPTAPGSTVSCDDCHPSTTFREYDCTGCHLASITDPYHAGVTSYPAAGTATSADCYGCHPQGTGVMTPEQHALYFTMGTHSHPAVCTQCHSDPTRRADLSTLRCVTCHESTPTSTGAAFGTAHARVNDYRSTMTSDWCIRCHADDQVDRIATHGAYPDPTGYMAGSAGPGLPSGKHTNAACLDCHTMVPPAFPNPTGTPVPDRPWAQNWPIASCNKTGCH